MTAELKLRGPVARRGWHVSVLAHDVERIAPEPVYSPGRGASKVGRDPLTPLLIEAVNEYQEHYRRSVRPASELATQAVESPPDD